MTISTTERLLRKAAEGGSAAAAVELARREARKDREKRKPNLTQLRAQDRDELRKATSQSRATSVIGPPQKPGYAERVLEWLASGEPGNSPLGERCEREFQEWRAACDAEQEDD